MMGVSGVQGTHKGYTYGGGGRVMGSAGGECFGGMDSHLRGNDELKGVGMAEEEGAE